MDAGRTSISRSSTRGPIGGIGGRLAASAVRPLSDVAGMAAGIGLGTLNDARVQDALRRALASDGVRQLIDDFFESGLFDHLVDRLLASDALWRLVDEIATSPAVTAAVSQQGLGFADQIGGAVRERSRRADRRLERTAERLRHPRHNGTAPDGGGQTP